MARAFRALSSDRDLQGGCQRGFSLIEVCIALIVIGLITVPFIQMYRLYLLSKQLSDTQAALTVVNSALIKYVSKYGHYPVPAEPNSAMGAPGYGAEGVKPGGGWPGCTLTSAVVCKTTTNTFAGRSVLIGTVPFAAIGVPLTAAIDGYGMKLTYAVTEDLTSSATYNENNGGIEVLKLGGQSIYFMDTSPADGIDDLTVPRSHAVVLSHGEDMVGAFTNFGVRPYACDPAMGIDYTNCDNDGTFSSTIDPTNGDKNVRSYQSGPTHIDDLLVTNNIAATGLWSFIPTTPNMRSTNSGNTYIGNCEGNIPCIPQSRVDVYGDIRADKVKATRMCSANPGPCVSNFTSAYAPPYWAGALSFVGAPPAGSLSELMPPAGNPWDSGSQAHLGAGIRCVGDRGLNAIGSGAYGEVCNFSSAFNSSVSIGSCIVPGTYAKGLDASGHLVCVLP